jgi:hypothetical protein
MATAALAAGNALIEAKELVRHGEWRDWLKANCSMSTRTAQRYMQMARSGLNAPRVALLGIRGASEAIARREAAIEFRDASRLLYLWAGTPGFTCLCLFDAETDLVISTARGYRDEELKEKLLSRCGFDLQASGPARPVSPVRWREVAAQLEGPLVHGAPSRWDGVGDAVAETRL